jgi:hypothetical protein
MAGGGTVSEGVAGWLAGDPHAERRKIVRMRDKDLFKAGLLMFDRMCSTISQAELFHVITPFTLL